jgi:hypothetical protein
VAALSPDGLARAAREALALAGETSWIRDFYLAGSAALTLHVGHRRVASLDLMASANRLTGPERRDLLQGLLELEPATEVETARDGYLFVRFGETPVRFFFYPYPVIDPFEVVSGVDVVSAVDLGLMKLGAIISRGTRRDFVDLYLLCGEVALEQLLERADEKFGHVRDFPLQALKGLADLSLIGGEPMPRLTDPLDWETVERWLHGEVRRLGDPESATRA